MYYAVACVQPAESSEGATVARGNRASIILLPGFSKLRDKKENAMLKGRVALYGEEKKMEEAK